MTMLEHARYLAKKGFHVFPVKANAKFPPYIEDFPSNATADEEQIDKWWSNGHSDSNIGISTTCFNESEALIVVDVDQKEGKMGEDELLRLELEGFDFPTTAEQTTPNGGRHLIYKTKDPVKQGTNVLAPGIDIRSRGGYVLGSGSKLSNGKYLLNDREIAWAPEWLVSRCGRPSPKPEVGTSPGTHLVDRENAIKRARHYLEVEAPQAIQGAGGNQTTFSVAARIKDFGVPWENCFSIMLTDWNNECSPPWASEDLQTIVINAYRYGEKPVGADSPEAVFTKISQETIKGENKSPNKNALFGEKFKLVEPNLHQTFLVENLLSPHAMSVMYGESGSGKTFFALDLGLHIALGQVWQTKKTHQGLVIYVAAEGSFGIKKRIKAFRQYHKLEGTDVPFVLVPCPIDLLDPRTHVNELLALVFKYEKEFGLKTCLIVVDTLARAMGGGNENTAPDMGAFVKNVDLLKNAANAHLMIIHHSGKDSAKGARGHSSLRAATDTEIEIAGLTAKIKKQRDMEFCDSIGFRLEPIQIGSQADGKPVHSCVVLPDNTSSLKDFSKKALDPSSLAGKGLEALQRAIDWHGQPIPDDLDLDPEKLVASIDDWREQFYLLAYPGKEKKRTWGLAFTRMVEKLIESGHVKKTDIWAWI